MAATRLRAAVVGDSVVWGQGHPDSLKFYNLAFTALRAAGAIDVAVPVVSEAGKKRALFTAQSGAQASNVDERGAFVVGLPLPAKVDPRTAVSGEIPSGRPSVRDQLRSIAPHKDAIDLVVMDGGANDIDFVAAGMPFAGSQDEAVATATRYLADAAKRAGMEAKEYFFSRFFEDRLRSIALALADARALAADYTFYTGYYPGLSEDTSVDELAGLTTGVGAAWIASALIGPLGLLVGLYAGLKTREKLVQATRQVEYFYAKLTGELTRHIARHNLQSGDSVQYVSPRFTAANAMFADKAWIYAPTDGGDATIKKQRTDLFEARTRSEADFFVKNAHVAHPNVEGSKQYGRRLAEEIDRCVHVSLRREAERVAPGAGVAAALDKLGPAAGFFGSVRALLRLAVVETVEFTYRFKHRVVVFDGDATDHFLCKPVRLRTAAGDFSGRAFRTQRHLEVLFDLRGVDYQALRHLTFEFEEFNLLRDPEGALEVFVNGYSVLTASMTAAKWVKSPRSGHRQFTHTLR